MREKGSVPKWFRVRELPVKGKSSGNSPLHERLTFVLGVCVLSRLLYLLFGALIADVLPPGDFHLGTPDVPFGSLSLWAHWDGVWYSQIAVEGYAGRGEYSTGFFPLYPLLVRSFAEMFGGPLTLGAISFWGMLLSLLLLPFGLYFVYRIAEDGWSREVARRSVLILAFFPTSFFLNAAYTESLFLTLSAGALWAVRVRKDMLLACVFAALAAATRNVGIFLVAPLAIEWMRGIRDHRWNGAYVVLVPSGLLSYMGYLAYRFGDPLLFNAVQEEHWHRTLTDPLTLFRNVSVESYEGLRSMFAPPVLAETAVEGTLGRIHEGIDAYNLLFLILAAILLVLGTRTLPLSMSVYAFLITIPTAFVGTPSNPLMGFPRYLLVAFPLFIVLGILLENRRALQTWLVLSASFSLVLCALFVSWRFVA